VWALTGSTHFFKKCLRMVGELEEVDLVYPGKIDLKNTERLKSSESTIVVESLTDLRAALGRRKRELHG
jgi:hypothetical protein